MPENSIFVWSAFRGSLRHQEVIHSKYVSRGIVQYYLEEKEIRCLDRDHFVHGAVGAAVGGLDGGAVIYFCVLLFDKNTAYRIVECQITACVGTACIKIHLLLTS
jgi:hypothetical protein